MFNNSKFDTAREEILRLSGERLKNKVDSIMFSINMILSNPDKTENQVDRMTELLTELSIVESAFQHSKNLLSQSLAQRISELESLQKETLEQEPKNEE
jgi:hypothetical protein